LAALFVVLLAALFVSGMAGILPISLLRPNHATSRSG
jgi:hypothetical protein